MEGLWGAETSVPGRGEFDLSGDKKKEVEKGTDGQVGLEAESTPD